MTGPLKQVGFWREFAVFDRRPDPRGLVDVDWSPASRAAVVAYLKAGRVLEAYFGNSKCRICGRSNGCQDMTDEAYVWPSGYAHYVEDHDVKPPDAFITHCFERLGFRKLEFPYYCESGVKRDRRQACPCVLNKDPCDACVEFARKLKELGL